jgi:exodeoxyribonuclease-5
MTFEPCSSAGRHSPYQCRIVEEVTYEPRQLIAGYRNLIVLDEASMIGQGTLNDVLAFGVPVVLVGDPGQLQPVKEQPNRYMMAPDATLKENFRQAEDNGIVDLALMARQNGRISLGRYGDGSTVVASWVHDPAIMDCVNPARLTPGPDTAVITWQRKTRAVINKLIHGLAAGSDAMVPVAGDRVIALQNVLRPVAEQREDGSWNLIGETHLHNNAMGTVRDAWRLDRRLRTIRLVVELDETSSGRSPGPLVVSDAVLDQFGAHDKLRPDQRPRANNMLITLWDFAYAATCHTSQGNEFSKVAVIEETANLPDYRRWMYTAASRAREKLIVLTGRV